MQRINWKNTRTNSLIALLLFGHGFVYFNLGRKLFNSFAGWRGTSILLGQILSPYQLETAITILWFLAGFGFMSSTVILFFLSQIMELWQWIVYFSSLLGIFSFMVFWDGQIHRLVDSGLIGVVIDIAICCWIFFSGQFNQKNLEQLTK